MSTTIKYCLPIINPDSNQIRVIINDNSDKYQYFEVWLDYIDNLSDDFVQSLCDQLGSRLILLFRRQNLEPIKLDKERRLAIIRIIQHTNALLDLDISQHNELEFIRETNSGINLLISYHDYESTPDRVRLEKIIDIMETYKPSIYKLATLCEEPEDALLLLQILLKLKASGKSVIVLGMGDFGSPTRVFGTLWGNEMVFAPENKNDSTGIGQLTRDNLEKIFNALG